MIYEFYWMMIGENVSADFARLRIKLNLKMNFAIHDIQSLIVYNDCWCHIDDMKMWY